MLFFSGNIKDEIAKGRPIKKKQENIHRNQSENTNQGYKGADCALKEQYTGIHETSNRILQEAIPDINFDIKVFVEKIIDVIDQVIKFSGQVRQLAYKTINLGGQQYKQPRNGNNNNKHAKQYRYRSGKAIALKKAAKRIKQQ